ncbi:MAG: DinB family protein [Vicinamibacterales bacterium]|nr:DinB family protein [Vicinamibacterales bacterium]
MFQSSMLIAPEPGEYGEFYSAYVALVRGEPDIEIALERQLIPLQILKNLTPQQAAFRYEDGKWSVKQVMGHMADAERIFAYRLLRVARADQTPLPGFDENSFVEHANFDDRTPSSLALELAAARQATLELVRGLDGSVMTRRSTINNAPATARALVFILAGHFAHHLSILRDRYRLQV